VATQLIPAREETAEHAGRRRDLWSIVLAAGEGSRLHALTRALYGEDLPKQFAQFEPQRSLLQACVERALFWSTPERSLVVVASEREDLARRQLDCHGGVCILSQPLEKGTAPSVLLGLSRVLAADREGLVVLLPSDHFVRDDGPFRDAVARARARAAASGAAVVLGALPDSADPYQAWVVPRPSRSGESYVDRFEEAASPAAAQRLREAGALWNTEIVVAPAARLWQLAYEHLPEQAHALERCHASHPADPEALREVYAKLSSADFARDVLARSSGLEVVSLSPCGWSDWGTPERVFASLHGTAAFERLAERLPSKQHRLAWKPKP
jgi:mannose-1-phosphate guanylyltransferase